MKKLIVHIGYPKTASTSLQLNFFSSLHRDGYIEYLNHLNRSKAYLGDKFCRNILDYVTGMTNDLNQIAFMSELDELKESEHSVNLISSENLSFFCEGFSWAYFNSNAMANAGRLKKAFSKIYDEIEIIITIRSQSTIVPSFYRQQFNLIRAEERSFSSFDKWIKANFGDDKGINDVIFNYYALYAEYAKCFGKKNIHLLLFEDLKADKGHIYLQLAGIFEVDRNYVDTCLSNNIQNQSWKNGNDNLVADRPTLENLIVSPVRNVLKRHVSADIFNDMKKVYREISPKSLLTLRVGKRQEIQDLDPFQRNLIRSRFRESNMRLFDEANIDLSKMYKYGYV